MKRKRKGASCPSPLLDDSPKRIKVHAQRKFAQGSNVNSPVITPIKELESEIPQIDVLQEPVELLPLKRPNTEDFLTFLCFRGTPVLPQTLNFLNTASIVDNNGQVHEIKSESSPKNGPIDISKCGTSSEKPFIAFGVRKRADPIVISRQMDRKRRHALAIQALRRKYQEQKMAKIRALTISKLSEKVTNRTLVRTNTVSKTETVTKKSSTLQKTKVIATKHVKVTTRTLKTTMRPKIKQKMCLRSFRGRFVQKELPFRKRIAGNAPTDRKVLINTMKKTKKSKMESENVQVKEVGNSTTKTTISRNKVVDQKLRVAKNVSPRLTRSGLSQRDISSRRQQIKKRILVSSTPIIVKPRSLRSTTLKKTIMSRRKSRVIKTKPRGKLPNVDDEAMNGNEKVEKPVESRKEVNKKIETKKEIKKVCEVKKESARLLERNKKLVNKSQDYRKEITKADNKELNRTVEIRKRSRISNIFEKKEVTTKTKNVNNHDHRLKRRENRTSIDSKPKKITESPKRTVKRPNNESQSPINSEKIKRSGRIREKIKKHNNGMSNKDSNETSVEESECQNSNKKKISLRSKPAKTADEIEMNIEDNNLKTTQRPSRKTKEAAAIYMELLSQKLVDDKVDDEDDVSIDSFPELPNVKKTQQREKELKAQAKPSKDDKLAPNPNDDVKLETLNAEFVGENSLKGMKVEVKSEDEKKLDQIELNVAVDDLEVQKIEDIPNEPMDIANPIPEKKVDVSKNTSQVVIDVETSKLKSKPPRSKEDSVSKVDEDADNKNKKNNVKKIKRPVTTESGEEISEDELPQRKTRNSKSHQEYDENDCGSDESFHIDVKIPRCKKVTRSQKSKDSAKTVIADTKPKSNIINEKSSRSSRGKNNEEISSDSDHSTTSEINLQALAAKAKNKKFSKTKSMKKSDDVPTFSDSDEEPLSKLTGKSIDSTQGSLADPNARKESRAATIAVKNSLNTVNTPKPKRECTKKPQNYLPMLSSSDEDEIFHGFGDNIKETFKPSMELTCLQLPKKPPQHVVPPLLELLNSGENMTSSRRFGKEKVNMSNEQIEKWLKDAALAGNSIKKENDEMLKFGERIPTETTLQCSNSNKQLVDTEKLKLTLLVSQKEVVEKTKDNLTPLKLEEDKATKPQVTMGDRKLIFRKGKKDSLQTSTISSHLPNVQAFSPENESSVYAFGEDNEEVLNTPFRRPSRRPSSTATSKSEDESSKHEDTSKSSDVPLFQGYFRKPPTMKHQQQQDILKNAVNNNSSGDTNATNVVMDIADESAILTNHQFYMPQKPATCKTSNVTMIKSQSNTSIKLKNIESKTSLLKGAATTNCGGNNNSSAKIINDKSTSNTSSNNEWDEFKYKVPSSPSASSSSSAKLYKRQTQKQKGNNKVSDFMSTSVYVADFPKKNESARLVEAPVFHPTEQEFQDPLEYIERIRHKAEQFGFCRIVPPSTFKPECKVSDDMRFTSYNQYVHKMLHRWGPNFKELMAIKKYLATQNISLTHPPWIGGMEIDLPRLYQTVQSLGGLKEVIEKKKWPKVSELMKIPKSAQDRVTKLDDIYCKYLLPYDTLSPAEREKLFEEVEADWVKKEAKTLLKMHQKYKMNVADVPATNKDDDSNDEDEEEDDDSQECIVKGRNMALNAFYRIARNTMTMHFKNVEPLAHEVELEYWKHVTQMQNHICVHSGSIDSGSYGYGFAVTKNSPFARHPWNLKVLTNNNGSLLRSLGPIMGVTVPTLHVGMVFSACCWYRDPHGLPWIEYLHTGGNKIWYGIPNSASLEFRTAMRKLMPNCCYDNDELWLASDAAMVPPALLTAEGVSMSRTVQEPGQFVVVFPKVFTSSISTGYVVSESVYFAPSYWLKTAKTLFDSLRSCCESSMFSLDRLVLSLAIDGRCSNDILRLVLPHVVAVCDVELELRKELAKVAAARSSSDGQCFVMERERMPLPEGGAGGANGFGGKRKGKKQSVGEEGDYECEVCRLNLFVSMVFDTHEGVTYCLEHGIELIKNGKSLPKNCKFMFTYDDDELLKFPDRIRTTIESRMQKKVPSKYAGMPTLLK